MTHFFRGIKIFPAIASGIINSNTNIAYMPGEENKKITREDFLKYKENDQMYEYLKLKKEVYDQFKLNLNENNFDKTKKIFDETTVYGLQYTQNVCHCNEWKIYKDLMEIALNNDYDKFVWFYENLIKNYFEHLKKESKLSEKLVFYDNAWRSDNEVTLDIYKKFSNELFRDLVYCYSNNKNTNENSYKILKYMIWTNDVHIDQISYAQNSVCSVGDFKMFKFLDSNVNINYNIEHGDFFRSACSKGHLEIAKILFEKKVHELNKFGFDNTFYIVCRDCNNINVIKWLCSIYDGKHINELKNLFNSEFYNKEIKSYLEKNGYIF
jgi:hypothetical protein